MRKPAGIPLGDIELPPKGAEGERAAAGENKPLDATEVATLRFLDPTSVEKVVTLKHPFEWGSKTFETITVRRLTVAQVGALVARINVDKEDVDILEFYAQMMGLPVAVLRALPEDDGVEVMAAADPFLPRFGQALIDVLSHDIGADTP